MAFIPSKHCFCVQDIGILKGIHINSEERKKKKKVNPRSRACLDLSGSNMNAYTNIWRTKPIQALCSSPKIS